MKILFVNPPVGAWSTHGNHLAPNQFHAQLIAYVREKKLAEVAAIDARGEKLDFDQTIMKMQLMKPDFIFLGEILHSTGGFAPIWYFLETARRIKELLPNVKIAVGGLWFSAMWKETLEEHKAVDFVILGEAELTLEDVLKGLAAGKTDFSAVAGLASRKGNEIVLGPHRALIPDLNILPTPAYDLFPMDKYVGHTYWKPFAELMTSRGCPGGCTFCYEWSQYDARSPKDFVSWRIKSAENILNELEVLNKTYGTKVIVFQDDAFNVNKATVEAVCRGMIKRKIDMNWVILGRADDWTRQLDIIPLMKEAGMFMGLLGVEVGSDAELKKIGKNVNTHQIVETIQALRKHGIMSVGTFMVGFEDDDEAGVKQRFEFADNADPDIFALQFFTPVPGSPFWKKYIERGWINPKTIDLRKWDFQHPVVPTNKLSMDDVGRLGAWCVREFFGKPERAERLFTGNYHELAKLCVKDYMANVGNFEKGATEGHAGKEILWNAGVQAKFKQALEKMPVFQRGMAEKMITKKAFELAKEANAFEVSEKELVCAFFAETPGPFKGIMKNMLKEINIDYTKYVKE